MKLSVVLPCYNEANGLRSLVVGYATAARRASMFEEFELILVDNGSFDDSAQIMEALAESYPFVVIVRLGANAGYGGGMAAGLSRARGTLVAVSHGDGQCDPGDVFKAFALAWQKGRLLVKGVRHSRPWGAFLFSRGFELLAMLLLRKWLWEVNAQPKVFANELVPAILVNPPSHFGFDLHVMLRASEAGFATRAIPVVFPDRQHGKSSWSGSLRSRLKHSLALIHFMRGYQASSSKYH